MDMQNSGGSNKEPCHAKATLHYASTLKSHIQNQVFELTTALRKVEHELIVQIDQQCCTKLQGLEYLCKNDKCSADCQNLSTQFDDDEGFPKKSKLDWDFKISMGLLQNYGQTRRKIDFFNDFKKVVSRTVEANKNTPVKEQVESTEKVNEAGGSEDCFEFVDSVECIAEERRSMNDSVCANAQTPLPAIVRLPMQPEANTSKVGSPAHTTFYLPRRKSKECTGAPGLPLYCLMPRRSPQECTGLFGGIPKRSPPQKTHADVSGPAEDKVYMFTSKGTATRKGEDLGLHFSFHNPAQEIDANASVQTTTEVVDDVEVIPSTSEANATVQQEMHPTSTASPEKQSAVSQAENKPANALQDSFKPYLQKQDMKAWVHPNSQPRVKGVSYEDWVFRAATPTNRNPLAELPKDSACASDGISAFYKQLQAFVA